MDKDFNIINHFLAYNNDILDCYDVLLLLGNALPYTSLYAYDLYKQGKSKYFMIAGGRGHTTDFMVSQISENIETKDLSEAQILKNLIEYYYGPDDTIILETKSTNCGENIIYALDILKDVHSILLIHDPLMQRRIDTTAKHYNKDIHFYNHAPFIPHVINNKLSNHIKGLYPFPRYVSLLLGEMKRLIDDENGYGPSGKNYIDYVDVPVECIEAYHRILERYSYLQRL